MGAVASQMTTFTVVFNCAIQITICVEYRDMLPRPRLVCQEPGLRPIGRSPGVPDKSSRGLGSMSRYSAQILICFIAYIFLFFPLWVWLGTLQDCQYAQCPLQLSNVIRMRLVIRQSTPPACLAEVQLAHMKTLSGIYATGLKTGRIWQVSQSCQAGFWEYFPSSLALKKRNMKMECWF